VENIFAVPFGKVRRGIVRKQARPLSRIMSPYIRDDSTESFGQRDGFVS
jgi:hypothetical protein